MKTIKLLALLFMPLMIVGCSEEFEEVALKELPFIQLSEDADINDLTVEQKAIISSAEPRFRKIINKEGLIELKVRSAKEVNVSENIFLYFEKLVENSNNFILRSSISARSRLISRSPEPTDMNMFDCVLRTIMYAKGLPESEVRPKIEQYFTPNGVLLGNIETVLGMFGTVVKVPKSSFRTPETFDHDCIVICQPENNPANIGHAYYGTEQESNGFIKGYDAQMNCDISLPLGYIYGIYMYQ